MQQIPLDISINLCTPSFFYNVASRHNFLLYDFRPTHNHQKVKNTLIVDPITLSNWQLTSTQDLERYIETIQNESEKQNIRQLFKQRKRIFNFFLPFNFCDTFTIYLSDKLYRRQEIHNSAHNLYISINVKELEDICHDYGKEVKDEIKKPEFQWADSPLLTENNSARFFDSSKDLYKIHHNEIAKSNAIMSTPNLSEYDILEQPISNMEIVKQTIDVLKTFKNEKFRELYIIFEPADIIFKQYPFLDYTIPCNRKYFDKSFPNEIIEGKLFLGNAEHAKSRELLVDILKITHIINSAKEVKNLNEQNMVYLNVEIKDEESEEILLHFDTVYHFIDNVWESECFKVFIHCAQGRSRSATLVVMFLMRKFGWDLKKAYSYVQSRREIIDVNYGFMQQLEKYEQILKDRKMIKNNE